MSYTYKVKNDSNGAPLLPDGTTIPNIGIIVNGQVESAIKFENPNFVQVDDEDAGASHLNGVAPQSQQSAPTETESEQ